MSNKIRKKIHAFIIENCESEISSLSDNTPIFESGLFKSVQIMDLILFVEEISGKEVDVGAEAAHVGQPVRRIAHPVDADKGPGGMGTGGDLDHRVDLSDDVRAMR